jgi:hypothetical protein
MDLDLGLVPAPTLGVRSLPPLSPSCCTHIVPWRPHRLVHHISFVCCCCCCCCCCCSSSRRVTPFGFGPLYHQLRVSVGGRCGRQIVCLFPISERWAGFALGPQADASLAGLLAETLAAELLVVASVARLSVRAVVHCHVRREEPQDGLGWVEKRKRGERGGGGRQKGGHRRAVWDCSLKDQDRTSPPSGDRTRGRRAEGRGRGGDGSPLEHKREPAAPGTAMLGRPSSPARSLARPLV